MTLDAGARTPPMHTPPMHICLPCTLGELDEKLGTRGKGEGERHC